MALPRPTLADPLRLGREHPNVVSADELELRGRTQGCGPHGSKHADEAAWVHVI